MLGACEVTNRILRPLDGREDLVGGSQDALAGRCQHHPLADAEEEGRTQARLDVAELVTESRLGEVKYGARPRQAAGRADFAHELQVTNLQVHASIMNSRAHEQSSSC